MNEARMREGGAGRSAAVQGLAGWVLAALQGMKRRGSEARAREMELVETLALGPKARLQMVRCGGVRFLVGSGADGVQTIVRVDGAGGAE